MERIIRNWRSQRMASVSLPAARVEIRFTLRCGMLPAESC